MAMTTRYRIRSSIAASVSAAVLVLAGVASVEMSGRAPAPTPAAPAADSSITAGSTLRMPVAAPEMPAVAVEPAQADLELVGASIANYDR
jgi:hypothetical protein